MTTTMKVHLHTDHHVVIDAELGARIEANVAAELTRFADHLTRVDVHLTGQGAGKGEGAGVRCSIEARPSGRGPITVTHGAANATAALDGAVAKLVAAVGHTFDRLEDRRTRGTIRGR